MFTRENWIVFEIKVNIVTECLCEWLCLWRKHLLDKHQMRNSIWRFHGSKLAYIDFFTVKSVVVKHCNVQIHILFSSLNFNLWFLSVWKIKNLSRWYVFLRCIILTKAPLLRRIMKTIKVSNQLCSTIL